MLIKFLLLICCSYLSAADLEIVKALELKALAIEGFVFDNHAVENAKAGFMGSQNIAYAKLNNILNITNPEILEEISFFKGLYIALLDEYDFAAGQFKVADLNSGHAKSNFNFLQALFA